MTNPLEEKRRGYLNFFKDGVADALLDGSMDDNKRSSAYYKKGYDFGLTMWNRILENDNGKESQDNGKDT
jgi:hypothetical protein